MSYRVLDLNLEKGGPDWNMLAITNHVNRQAQLGKPYDVLAFQEAASKGMTRPAEYGRISQSEAAHLDCFGFLQQRLPSYQGYFQPTITITGVTGEEGLAIFHRNIFQPLNPPGVHWLRPYREVPNILTKADTQGYAIQYLDLQMHKHVLRVANHHGFFEPHPFTSTLKETMWQKVKDFFKVGPQTFAFCSDTNVNAGEQALAVLSESDLNAQNNTLNWGDFGTIDKSRTRHPSLRAPESKVSCDNVFTKGLKVINYEKVLESLSDHHALSMEFDFIPEV